MTSSESGDVLDMGVIASLRELGGETDPDLLIELIDLFLADAPQHLEAIEQALRSGDSSALEHAAHSLKSSCANIGALEMSSFCFQLEVMGREQRAVPAPELATQAREQFALVRDALTAIKS